PHWSIPVHRLLVRRRLCHHQGSESERREVHAGTKERSLGSNRGLSGSGRQSVRPFEQRESEVKIRVLNTSTHALALTVWTARTTVLFAKTLTTKKKLLKKLWILCLASMFL